MRTKALVILVLAAGALAGCGDSKQPREAAPPTATPAADGLAGYSEGVRKYYAGANLDAADDPNADAEVQYFQPPRPAEAAVGDTITLTGSNIGVRMRVTLTQVDTLRAGGKRFTAVHLRMLNDGITVYDGELKSAALLGGGEPVGVAEGARAACSNGFDAHVRIDVSRRGSGCLLFPAGGRPERFQLALETIPVEAGGIWNLSPR
jgi:hypothetical protein